MTIKIQLLSLIFSFFYGIFFYLMYQLCYKILHNKKIKVISNIIFVILNTLLYFYFLLKINNGIVHIYLLFSSLFGYILCSYTTKKF